jgi:hypothetical protein
MTALVIYDDAETHEAALKAAGEKVMSRRIPERCRKSKTPVKEGYLGAPHAAAFADVMREAVTMGEQALTRVVCCSRNGPHGLPGIIDDHPGGCPCSDDALFWASWLKCPYDFICPTPCSAAAAAFHEHIASLTGGKVYVIRRDKTLALKENKIDPYEPQGGFIQRLRHALLSSRLMKEVRAQLSCHDM